jgi:hypothetical protein
MRESADTGTPSRAAANIGLATTVANIGEVLMDGNGAVSGIDAQAGQRLGSGHSVKPAARFAV